MEKLDLVTIIEAEINSSIGGDGAGSGSIAAGGSNSSPINTSFTAQLASERAMELDYYNSKPFGNERDGESQVVSSDVFDAVEGMLPYLLSTFTKSGDAVEFMPEGEEDDEAAQQRTELCNYVFYRQNNGFLLMYEWFKDALLQKNGVVKYWWDEKEEISEDDYEGLTEGEYLMLKQEENTEILSESHYDDPDAVEKKQQMVAQLQAHQPTMGHPAAPVMMQQIDDAPLPQLYDCKVKRTKDISQICIKAIPPEEFGISAKHPSISMQDAPFVYHRTKMTMSDLKAMGCPQDVLDDIDAEDSSQDIKPETLARNRFIDETTSGVDADIDPSMKEVWVVDGFIRIDWDGDGLAELRHFIMPSRTLWVNEKSSHINFAAITPIIMPHRWIGKSIAEVVMDFQFMNSVLLRQMFNNLYLSNNPQKVVLGSSGGLVQADLDRLMTSRVGGILVEYAPNAIRNIETPFVAGASFPMLEYMEGKKEQRTGNTRYNQGTDADSLNKTARGIQIIQSAAQQKIDLIARIFAETGVKDLFRGIAYFLSKYSQKKMTIRLRNKWVDIDPREWKTQFDMTVNVGLGTGNKDAQLVHLVKMHDMQVELMKEGKGYMVSDQNIFNLAKKTAENMGFKHPEIFLSDPNTVKPPPPQPNPEMLKIQQADKEATAKIQSNEKIRQFDAQTQKEVESIKANALITVEQMRIQSSERMKQLEIRHAAELAIFKANNEKLPINDAALERDKLAAETHVKLAAINKDWEEAKLRAATSIQVAETAANATLTAASMQAQKAASDEVTKAIAPKAESQKMPDVHIHMGAGKKKLTSPDGKVYTSEPVE